VESLAVAIFAIANFLAADGFASFTGSAPGLLTLAPSVSLGFAVAEPISDFFCIAIFAYPFRANLPRPESLADRCDSEPFGAPQRFDC
jgi:hypothetical protein